MDTPTVLAKARYSRLSAFSLIELLIVIAIIAILAGLIFPITKSVNRNKLRSRIRAEIAQVETAVDSYKSKLGFYPPDNPGNPVTNQLFYELVGTKTPANNRTTFETLDGRFTVTEAELRSASGGKITGIMNNAPAGGSDEETKGVNFFRGVKGNQIGMLSSGNSMLLLICSVPWPEQMTYQPTIAKGLNPWRYNSSSPTNNPGTYDLWVDVMIDGKTNRFSNWSKEPIINPYP